MSNIFNAEFYECNRKKLRTLFQGTAPIVITANGKLQKGTSDHFRLYQDGNFLYLTGINEPDVILVLDKDKEYLILPDRSDGGEAFYGALDPTELIQTSGIPEVLDYKTGWKRLTAKIKKVKHVATLAPSPVYIEHYDFYTNPARATVLSKLKEINQNLEPLDLNQHMALLRMIKQGPELVAMQRAIDITTQAFKNLKRRLPKFEYEYQIEALLAYDFRSHGADGIAYDTIAASGAKACIMHYGSNSQLILTGQSVMIDAGASYNRYAADITRSFMIGTPTKRHEQVWTAVKEVYDFAVSNLKPGISIRQNERAVEQFMGEKLRSLGLIRNVEHAEIRTFFPHATSHFLGLDVHDVGDYDRPLEPGVTLTIEPGIYIPSEGIGIRLEDDFVVTEDGVENLSTALPLDL